MMTEERKKEVVEGLERQESSSAMAGIKRLRRA